VRRDLLLGALTVLGVVAASPALAEQRLVVADRPTPEVREAALRALHGFPLDTASAGLIRTGWRERPAPGEGARSGLVEERVTVHIEPFADRVTRVRVEVEVREIAAGSGVVLPDREAIARAVLDALREALRK
jgi:hypothetical protein